MTNQTCKNCKHWRYITPMRGKPYHECMRVEYEGGPTNQGGADFALWAGADDDSGLECGLITGPDFGCAHFEPAKQPQSEA